MLSLLLGLRTHTYLSTDQVQVVNTHCGRKQPHCFGVGSSIVFQKSSCNLDEQMGLSIPALVSRVEKVLEAAWEIGAQSYVLIVTEYFQQLPCWRHFWSERWVLGSFECWQTHCLQASSALLYEVDAEVEAWLLSGLLLQVIKTYYLNK